MNILLFGPNGSGKGTQGAKIRERYHVAHIETGVIFRSGSRWQGQRGGSNRGTAGEIEQGKLKGTEARSHYGLFNQPGWGEVRASHRR
ncbi:MAG: hypothetical protein DRG87_00390 [Deltaproteobacteria bacterium]|nr:nucleoside monophosphate kinase [Deltaproteobacteria bacterium]MBW2076948.1 nucleoside monophosphate kinase [Deltaproteobacteria bacterium]MBW2311310.1 nucleoside monophosphate kinase [Deltaproteobacteria bacterium]RLB32168.1 MAG: hypothetical protein DRG87_00390 [Deltaproteobacteria bacterium]